MGIALIFFQKSDAEIYRKINNNPTHVMAKLLCETPGDARSRYSVAIPLAGEKQVVADSLTSRHSRLCNGFSGTQVPVVHAAADPSVLAMEADFLDMEFTYKFWIAGWIILGAALLGYVWAIRSYIREKWKQIYY